MLLPEIDVFTITGCDAGIEAGIAIGIPVLHHTGKAQILPCQATAHSAERIKEDDLHASVLIRVHPRYHGHLQEGRSRP